MITFSQIDNAKLAGRLGNNLFQIAVLAGMSLRYPLHDWFIPRWKYSKYFPEVQRHVGEIETPILTVGYTERDSYRFHDYPPHHVGLSDFRGYFQSYKYIDRDDARALFASPLIKSERIENRWVAVHVRRGDYLSKPICHPVQTVQYYREAMAQFPDHRFAVFSDDILWCEANLTADWFGKPGTPDIEDFCHMTHFQNFIIANSSFSWWAAWLSGSNNVIAPRQWSGVTDDLTDLIPPTWRTI